MQIEGITNELEGASLFFTKQMPSSPPPPQPVTEPAPGPEHPVLQPAAPNVNSITVMPPKKPENPGQGGEKNKPAKPNNSTPASALASTSANISVKAYDPIETIRKTVKQVGKEVCFIRITPEEKRTLGSIVYSFNQIYGGEGRKTSENEIGRIGLNFLLDDYRENGKNSILARVIAALNA